MSVSEISEVLERQMQVVGITIQAFVILRVIGRYV